MNQDIVHIDQLIAQHVDSHRTAGHVWPDTAEFCVVYNTYTWPCGWGKEAEVQFFDSRAELDTWINDKYEWAELEDNYFAFQAYEWELGPKKMAEVCHWTNHIGYTHAQRETYNLLNSF